MGTRTIVYFEHLHDLGGMDAYNRIMIYSILKLESRVVFITNKVSKIHLDSTFEVEVMNVVEPIKSAPKWKFFLSVIRSIVRARSKFSTFYFHVFDYGFYEFFVVLISSLTYSKTVLFVHDIKPLRKGFYFLRKLILKVGSSIVVHSDYARRLLVEEGFNKVTHVYGPDFDKLDVETRESDDLKKVRFLFFGQLKVSKGIDLLVRAWDDVRFRDAELHIIGRSWGYNTEILEKQCQSDSSIHFRDGYVESSAISSIFSRSDIVLLPYTEVYNSGVLKRALGYDKVVVVSDVPVFRELITDSVNGFMFETNDVDSLSAALKRAYNFVLENKSFSEVNTFYFDEFLQVELISSQLVLLHE